MTSAAVSRPGPDGLPIWVSQGEPGSTHDPTAARRSQWRGHPRLLVVPNLAGAQVRTADVDATAGVDGECEGCYVIPAA